MPLTAEEERRLEGFMLRSAERSRRDGMADGLARAIAAQARVVAQQDLADALSVLRGAGGFPEAVGEILRLAGSLWPDRWRRTLAPVLNEVARAATDPRLPAFPAFDLANPRMGAWFERHTRTLGEQIGGGSGERAVETIRRAQDDGASVPETSRRLRDEAGIADPERAERIARQELQRSSKGASSVQAKESGIVTTKTRLSARDGRVRDDHERWDGETVGIDEPYESGEQYPGETEFGCRCVEIYGIDYESLGL